MKKDYIGKIDDKEIEQALICLLINYHDSVRIHLPEIKDDFFWSPLNKKIYDVIKDLSQKNEPMDVITIARKINKPVSDLVKILEYLPSTSSIKSYIKNLKELSDKRWFISAINKIDLENHSQEIMTELSTAIINRLKERETEKTDPRNLLKEFEDYQKENEKHLKSGNKYIGIESGYPTIDNAINGIRKGHYWICNAYTNTGKSYFLLNITNRLTEKGKRVVFFSLEMSRVQNIGRLIGIQTGIDPTEIERGCLLEEQLEEENTAKAKLYQSKLSIHNAKRNIEDIITTIYAIHSSDPIDLIVIDYLQKIQVPKATSRYERYTTASDTIQQMCQETGIPAIVASQVDNESAKNKNLDIIATKGSGDVGGDADLAILLKKDEEKINGVQCIIQKNRHGQKGMCNLEFYSGGILSEI